ncbi:dolichyl-phosphate-mannose-protein mannosyltransferase [Tremella mesenterica]|uniref:Dolichyl-phosphate-mannose--protein mannosyltransferase n=1 Tax=Tremella mesenterica TaxID=5217 RepID=A0A4Q1BSG6_TREME|nr:dolichyl-phosphate-mannose-protein mannosyltransferase [Tremella mesenterica]
MQRTLAPPALSSSSSTSPAAAALRRTLKTPSHAYEDDEDELSDPRPWETRASLQTYGSRDGIAPTELPMFNENESRRRYGEKEVNSTVSEKQDLLDDQGKWAKGYGPGPSFRGRRGLPPRQRLTGWRGVMVEYEEEIWTAVYTLLSMITRYWRIGAANYVVWDEAHFGKFGSHYINRDFYFDVHPPLGKMLVGLAGLLSGYNGGFEFKSGVEYPEGLPYTTMRVMLASFGVALVPIAWWTSGEFGWSRWTRHWVTLCVLCDIGWLCISRFILLDSMLLFFTFTTTLGLVKFHSQRHDPFGEDWWIWLAFTGWSIGCVCSIKWVGMFVTALVGLYTIEDLWDKFGDLSMPLSTYIRHWVARIGCLMVLPFVVYAACFKIHFLILNRSGPGDAQMSSLFQAHLKGIDFSESPLEIAYGSKLTLKNYGYGGGLLHSHVQTLPVGSLQQQVTCYHYKDDNNHWVITPTWEEDPVDSDGPIRYLQHGDALRLVHSSTGRNLHSHSIAAPVTKENWEVSGYGNATIGDDNDIWVVEVVDDTHRSRKDQKDGRIHSLTTRMRFRHRTLDCYLRAANAVLPQWGFKQVEVSCVKENNPRDLHTYWNVESHWNDRLPPGDLKLYKSPFWRDFVHLNVAMWTSNNALVPDPDKEDILASKPGDWPFLRLGLRMCGWGDSQIKYYLLGTPIIWWASSVSLFVGLGLAGWYLLRMQRQYKDWAPGQWDHFLYVGKVAFFGWFLHYVPFLIMGRVTYLHHYLPTLWFAVLMAGQVLDHLIFSSPRRSHTAKVTWFVLWASGVVLSFWWFKDLALGIHGPVGDHWGWKWRSSWNIYN